MCEDDEDTEDNIYLWVLEYIQEVEMKIEKKTDEKMVPSQFHAYLDVFKKAPSERMPVRKPWDHAIDLNPNFVPRKSMLRHTQTTRVLAGLQEGIQEREREVYIDYSPHTLLEWRS